MWEGDPSPVAKPNQTLATSLLFLPCPKAGPGAGSAGISPSLQLGGLIRAAPLAPAGHGHSTQPRGNPLSPAGPPHPPVGSILPVAGGKSLSRLHRCSTASPRCHDVAAARGAGALVWDALGTGAGIHRPPHFNTSLTFG